MNNSSACHIIVLVTVSDIETHAILDVFLGVDEVPKQVPRGGLIYNDLGIHGGCRIMQTVCEMGSGGIGASQQRTSDAIQHWKPKAVIAVGIAFGLDETEQAIGDVLISTQIQDYELARVNNDGTLTPRGDKPSSADILCNRFRLINSNQTRSNRNWPNVQFGLVLSGQKLVDNLDYRKSLNDLYTEAIGGEMEGVGLYVSAGVARIDWIVVKAICDWGYNKSQADKDAWQKRAAKNAALVLKTALDVGGLYDDEPISETARIAESKVTAPRQDAAHSKTASIVKCAPGALMGREVKARFLFTDNGMASGSPDDEVDASLRVELAARYLSRLPGISKSIDEQVRDRMGELLGGDREMPKPFVFYHWRQKHEAIHWVDFYFLRVLQELQSYGFEARALVTEGTMPMYPIEEIVKKLLGAPPMTLAGIKGRERDYVAHTIDYVRSPTARDKILNHKRQATKAWIQFIPYFVRSEDRHGYLQFLWDKHYQGGFEFAFAYSDVKVAQVRTKDIRIHRVLAKKYGPPVFIEPMPCQSVRAWLARRPHPNYKKVEALVGYFEALDNAALIADTAVDESGGSNPRLKKEWIRLLGRDVDPRLDDAVGRLASILERWNKKYFVAPQARQ